ncbi:LOW QUALITY PROTEIN: UPF0565 protein C2orf69 homolog [Manduca sexta]|uniref:LOW QUALITY PROTEIN: UPF0565 protein C2orf69 homolog n=1 Tax=Manduca sexta TaxID=7130 RepID=UPI00188F12FC|nr:LOW QUALITY PROTEIN: UPF0565 protein C2orf69 homolog [Manduca sexta]
MPVRLRRVAGFEGRVNDIIFQPASVFTTPQQTLVYFGGDVQDYPEVMQAHRDNRNYVKWNLENMARMLAHTFPNKHVLVVKASRVAYKSFRCYDNFVPSNNAGVPEHTPTNNALQHLERLLQSVNERIKVLPTSELEALSPGLSEDIDIEDLHNSPVHRSSEQKKSNGAASTSNGSSDHKPVLECGPWWERVSLGDSRLALVGFSKGCVVLNQMLYEFHYTSTLTPCDTHAVRFIDRIDDMFWLDGGHAGGKNTWITSRSLLETLGRLKLNIHVHVSPYQVLDEGRPWIGREEKAFTSMLRKLGARIQRYMHGHPSASNSLQAHFDVLNNFKRAEDLTPDLQDPEED